MENYNEIPKTGTIGGMVDNINTNFQLTKEMLERLEVTKDHAVGLFSTLANLQAAYPSPEVGDWALVGDTTPFAIYKCTTAGTWTATGGTYDAGTIDLSDYVTKDEFDDAVASKIGYEEIDGMATENVASNRYIKYTNGTNAVAGAAGQFTMRWYTVEEGMERIRCELGSDGGTPAAIAFYSTEINTSGTVIGTYMAEQSVQAVAGVNVYDVAIPADAKSIVVSNRGANLATPTITIFKNPFSGGSGEDIEEAIAAYDKDVIKTRSAAAVTSAISDSINVSSLPTGTQILIDVTTLGGDSKAAANIYNSEGIFNSVPIVGTGKFYVEVQQDTTSIVIRKEAADGNIINYTATRTHDYTLTERYQQGYYPRKQAFALGELFKGYYNPNADDSENAKYSTSTWVSYPINKTSGFTIRLNADFTTYYIQFNIWNAALTGYTFRGITEQTDIDLRGVTAWNIAIRRVDRATVTPESMAGVVSVTFVSGRVFERPMMRYEVEEMIEESGGGGGGSTEDSTARLTAGEGYAVNPFANAPYYYHFAANGFLKDGSGNKMIASQSLEDVAVAARLGFKFIEANIKPTSDGNFVCIHGESVTGGTAFGAEAMSTDESEITTEELRTTLISSKTLAWIKQYVRYGSAYSKYQTTIPSLDEFCLACKQYGIGIFAGVMANKTAIETCQKYLGNNMIVYGAPTNARDYYKGYVMIWFNGSSYTAASILANAKMFGAPYMACLGPTTITALKSAGTLDTLISGLHAIGCLIGFASVYQTEAESRDLLGRGMDFSAAGHEVNDFYDYDECYTLESNSLPSTTGTISDGIATLASGQTITAGSATAIGLGKGYLTIRFSGKLTINFGSNGSSDRTITSDGTEVVVISDYFLHRKPQLVITAGAATTITDLEYKIKNCGVVGAAAEDATARSMATAAQTAAQAAQTTANEANAKKAVVQFDSIITGTTPSPMAGDESTTCSVVVYAEGDKRFYGKVSSSGSTYYAKWNGYKNYVDTANSNKPHGDRVYRCTDTGVSYTFAGDELQRIDEEAYRLASAALPASTIWSGTQAQYDALTAAQKAAVIAFIEEE